MKILILLLIFSINITEAKKQSLEAGCSLIDTWNNGDPDPQLDSLNLTNKIISCNLPKRDEHDIERIDMGLLKNSTTGINSITYTFKVGNQTRKETLNIDQIKNFMSKHKVNLENLLPDNHPNRRDEYVRLLLKEQKGIKNASSITVERGGIKLRPRTNLWADNGKGFSKVEVGYNFEFESCIYTSKRRVWYCTEKGCTETRITGGTDSILKICKAPVSCIGIDGSLHESEATCLAYGEGNCPSPSLCAQDVILKRLNLGTLIPTGESNQRESTGESR